MALVYTIKAKEVTGGAYTSIAPRSIQNAQVQTWDILMSDSARTLRPQDVTEIEVARYDQLPIVNQTVFAYYSPEQHAEIQIQPWLVCRMKRVQRDQAQRLLFHVTTEYATGTRQDLDESDLRLIDAVDDPALLPFLEENIYIADDRIIYSEQGRTGDAQELRLPTGNLYSEPFISRLPKRTVRVSQFEDITDSDIFTTVTDRLYTLQDVTYKGDPPTPYPKWMITNIEFQKVTIPRTIGSGGWQNALDLYLMTYTIEQTILEHGWLDRRILYDTHFLKTPNDLNTKEAYRDPTDGSTVIPALIDVDGTLLPDQQGEPASIDYWTQRVGQWSFLKGRTDP